MDAHKFQIRELAEVREAAERLRPFVRVTPLLHSHFDPEIHFKAESLQITGSFKARTACNQLLQLSDEDRRRGIVAASSGNFAQGVAYAASRLAISAKIVMMRRSSPLKVERTREWGAEVVFCEDSLEAREAAVAEISRNEERATVHPYDHHNAVIGNGVIALEILEQFPEVENIATPVSGGGLLSGVAMTLKALKPEVKVFGVQSAGNPTTFLSFLAGEPRSVERADTIADGLLVTTPGRVTFPLIQRFVDGVVVVEEETIRAAVKHFVERERLVVEPSGAVTLAALMEDKLPRQKTVLVLSGGNVVRIGVD